MYLKIKNKKLKIKELVKFWDKFKGLKFVLEPIDYGVKLVNKHFISTNFLCQKVDIVFTDKNDVIKYIFEEVKTEKNIFRFGIKNVYLLPLKTAKYLKKGEKINLITEKKS